MVKTPAGEILRKPPVSVPLVKHHVRYNKLMYDMYERYDPARGNCLDVGQVDAKQSFLAFPCGESQSLLSKSIILAALLTYLVETHLCIRYITYGHLPNIPH